jgi:hypothetical protein
MSHYVNCLACLNVYLHCNILILILQYLPAELIKIVKSRRIYRVGHITRVGQERNAHAIMVRKPLR